MLKAKRYTAKARGIWIWPFGYTSSKSLHCAASRTFQIGKITVSIQIVFTPFANPFIQIFDMFHFSFFSIFVFVCVFFSCSPAWASVHRVYGMLIVSYADRHKAVSIIEKWDRRTAATAFDSDRRGEIVKIQKDPVQHIDHIDSWFGCILLQASCLLPRFGVQRIRILRIHHCHVQFGISLDDHARLSQRISDDCTAHDKVKIETSDWLEIGLDEESCILYMYIVFDSRLKYQQQTTANSDSSNKLRILYLVLYK